MGGQVKSSIATTEYSTAVSTEVRFHKDSDPCIGCQRSGLSRCSSACVHDGIVRSHWPEWLLGGLSVYPRAYLVLAGIAWVAIRCMISLCFISGEWGLL